MTRFLWGLVVLGATTTAVCFLIAIYGAIGAYAITGTTETRQVVTFKGVQPKTPYVAYFYAYHYPNDPYPYALSYSGLPSNAYGEYKASVLLSDLSQEYEGGEGPVYNVKACLLEPPAYNEIYCTPYSYVGYVPPFLWSYTG